MTEQKTVWVVYKTHDQVIIVEVLVDDQQSQSWWGFDDVERIPLTISSFAVKRFPRNKYNNLQDAIMANPGEQKILPLTHPDRWISRKEQDKRKFLGMHI